MSQEDAAIYPLERLDRNKIKDGNYQGVSRWSCENLLGFEDICAATLYRAVASQKLCLT